MTGQLFVDIVSYRTVLYNTFVSVACPVVLGGGCRVRVRVRVGRGLSLESGQCSLLQAARCSLLLKWVGFAPYLLRREGLSQAG